jgi:Short C-terminal domain
MPGLLGGIARVAVASGTATAVSNRVSRRQASRWADQGQGAPAYMAEADQGQAAPPPPQAPAADPIQQLKELGELHQQGVLTDEEFAAQKAKLLA